MKEYEVKLEAYYARVWRVTAGSPEEAFKKAVMEEILGKGDAVWDGDEYHDLTGYAEASDGKVTVDVGNVFYFLEVP